MAIFFISDGFYMVFMLNQLFQETDQPSLSDWSILSFKILCLVSRTLYPFSLGQAAYVLGARSCHAGMHLPLSTLIYIIISVFVLNAGLGGIHLKNHAEGEESLLPLIFVLTFGFVAHAACSLVSFTWLYDYMANCPDGRKQKQITADETDAAVELFERLKDGTKIMIFLTVSFVQILIVFSLYNMLQGEPV